MKLENYVVLDDEGKYLPEFGRARDVERYFAIKRGLTYRWLKEGKIRSISLREPGRKFGVRLFPLLEIRALLLKKLAEQNGEVKS